MDKVKRYAEGTDVPAEKSRAELEALLEKHGATEFMVHKDAERTTLIYRIHGVMVRQRIEYPTREAHKRAKTCTRNDADITKAREAEWRRLWRAQLLITKAKLEMIANGGSTFEREFLADLMLPNGATVVESLMPQILDSYESGQMPKLLLGSGS